MEKTNNSKQAAWIALGSFFSFIVAIVSPMILSRYFEKADYGTYKQVMYVYSTLLAVFTLGLPRSYAYFIPKFDKDYTYDIIKKVTYIFFGLGFSFSIFLLLGSSLIGDLLNNNDLGYALIIFSPTPFFLLPTMGLDGIYAAIKQTRKFAIYTVITKILTILFTIIPVLLFDCTFIGALIGFDMASIASLLLAVYLIKLEFKNRINFRCDLKYKDIFSFSLPLLYASFWGMLIASSSQYFISRYFGNEEFADFSNGFIELPFVNMIITSIGAVLLPEFSANNKGGILTQETFSIWKNALIKSAKVIFPMLIFSVFFARLFMVCMYGDIYESSTIYFQIKNLSGLFFIIPFAPILLSMGKTKQYANIHLVVAILMIVLEAISVSMLRNAVAVAVVSESCQIFKIYLLMKVLSSTYRKPLLKFIPLKELTRVLFLSCAAAFLSFPLLYLDINKYILILICWLSFCCVYILLCHIFRLTYRDIIGSFIPNHSCYIVINKLLP